MAEKNVSRLRLGIIVLLVWGWLGFSQFRSFIYNENLIEYSKGLQVAQICAWIGLFFLLALAVFAWLGGAEKILSWLNRGMNFLRRLRWLSFPLVVTLFVLYPILVIGHFGLYLQTFYTRSFIFILFVLVGAALLSALKQNKTWLEMLPVSLLGLAVVYNGAAYVPHMSTYPFSLSGSEGSRYFYSSLFFSERIYGQDLPWPHSNFSRYLMLSVPFLFSSLPLLAHRLWQALLRFALPYLTGFILSRRLKLRTRRETFLFTLWTGLFFFQGPVFIQMLVMVSLVFGLFDSRKFWRSLFVVILASIWAGFTRINWVPMPGLMAAAFYFMECEVKDRDVKSVAKYLIPPAIWVLVGGLVGLFSQNWFVLNSGLPPELLEGAFSQDLLWYRLWPNPSYSLGIFPMIMLVTGAPLVYVVWAIRGWKLRWHPIRLFSLGAIMFVFFFGGLVISVKIGGGTNLHNLDAYITILLMIIVYLFYGKMVDVNGKASPNRPEGLLLSIIVLVPALFSVQFGGKQPEWDYEEADQILDRLQGYVDWAQFEEGEILFVSQRHLITFDIIKGVDLVYDYERMILMEMTMADNQTYLDMFSEDLKAQRFSLIIHDSLPGRIQEKDKDKLAEENNVYIERVTPNILCSYRLLEKIRVKDVGLGIDILIPKENQTCD